MRLFVAVDLPQEIRDELYKLQKSFSPNLAKIKWVSKKNLHLSLKFLGEVEVEDLKKIKDRLKSVNFEQFSANLSGFEISNNSKSLLCGISPMDKVVGLQQKVDEELLDLFDSDQKFSSHITLGRVKLVKKEKEFMDFLKNVNVWPFKFEIKQFRLMESKLTKDGPIYSIIEKFNK
ncbi:RNA 2',3'-cyclic phosphodiesterase [archaeon]|jgi:RNA 2',3'-cyclic 3'-phosphodiesterase|nr:RNA 2',3'-cyclic phosphodiesterase [archaeon]MBT6824114.1 RNA 2',3'-cyclic phosphodiesterase [archaeon]MBT7107041.1 RNA 2',3'-cyclic phosphodiesterase [archaeon]MBT7297653.1 RNA 2',3'-cyclic phosphodiesterase [archaeon]